MLLLPGRTEYIEKYGLIVSRLVGWGLNVAVIDWRGQGLSQRPIAGKSIGYVEDFAEYQDDLNTMTGCPAVAALSGPRILMSHSMGGCIALRALIEGLDVAASVFSAPMWGIKMPPVAAPLARALIRIGPKLGFEKSFAPGTGNPTYVSTAKAEGNLLTNNLKAFERFRTHAKTVPELCLGGASLGWLNAAFEEMAQFRREPAPTSPILTFLGDQESIVEPGPIHRETKSQANARLVVCKGAKHEIWMETEEIQESVWSETKLFLEAFLAKAPTT